MFDNIFVTEVQEIAKISTTKFIQDSLKGNKVNRISSNGENKLNLSGGDVGYYIELDYKGNITYLEVTNDSFCLQTDKDYKSITKEDVTDGRNTTSKLFGSGSVYASLQLQIHRVLALLECLYLVLLGNLL